MNFKKMLISFKKKKVTVALFPLGMKVKRIYGT